jgi:hypothetical protein
MQQFSCSWLVQPFLLQYGLWLWLVQQFSCSWLVQPFLLQYGLLRWLLLMQHSLRRRVQYCLLLMLTQHRLLSA